MLHCFTYNNKSKICIQHWNSLTKIHFSISLYGASNGETFQNYLPFTNPYRMAEHNNEWLILRPHFHFIHRRNKTVQFVLVIYENPTRNYMTLSNRYMENDITFFKITVFLCLVAEIQLMGRAEACLSEIALVNLSDCFVPQEISF